MCGMVGFAGLFSQQRYKSWCYCSTPSLMGAGYQFQWWGLEIHTRTCPLIAFGIYLSDDAIATDTALPGSGLPVFACGADQWGKVGLGKRGLFCKLVQSRSAPDLASYLQTQSNRSNRRRVEVPIYTSGVLAARSPLPSHTAKGRHLGRQDAEIAVIDVQRCWRHCIIIGLREEKSCVLNPETPEIPCSVQHTNLCGATQVSRVGRRDFRACEGNATERPHSFHQAMQSENEDTGCDRLGPLYFNKRQPPWPHAFGESCDGATCLSCL